MLKNSSVFYVIVIVIRSISPEVNADYNIVTFLALLPTVNKVGQTSEGISLSPEMKGEVQHAWPL